MTGWKSHIDLDAPCWKGYRSFLDALSGEKFPDSAILNTLLPPGTSSRSGAPIRFVPAADLPGVDYERHIFETGQVSTREGSWHDLFNALVWCRLPTLKAGMNSMHYQHLDEESKGRRGRTRDALTLLDESGVIVAGPDVFALEALARRDWSSAFVTHRDSWGSGLGVLVCGHAILEKFLEPYKSVTAHALLVQTTGPLSAGQFDQVLGRLLAGGNCMESPASLSPLPLMGIPGWWMGDQDPDFYRDREVFRPAARQQAPAPVHAV